LHNSGTVSQKQKQSDTRTGARKGEGHLPPGNVEKCFFAANVVLNLSIDEVFMHHFEKMSSASGGFAPDPHWGAAPGPCWGTLVLQTPSMPTPGKNPAGALGHMCRLHKTVLTAIVFLLCVLFCMFVV